MNINIGNLEYAPFYEMNKNELLDYLKNDLDFNDSTYPLIIEIVDENDHSMVISENNYD